MKQGLTYIFALALIINFSCKKEKLFYVTMEGRIVDGYPTDLDGCGWYIVVGDKSYRSENGLPEEFKQDDLKVEITFKVTSECKTNKNYGLYCCLDEIEIKSIIKK